MRKIRIKPWLLAAGAAVALSMGVAAPSQAQLQNFTFLNVNDGAGGTQTDSVVYFSSGPYTGVYAGRYHASLGSIGAINVFCTDFTHEILQPDSYSTLVALGQVTDPTGVPATLEASDNQYYYEAPLGGGGLVSAIDTTHDYKVMVGVLNGTQRANEVGYLTDKYLTANLTTNQYAGVQMAIWDIIQDGDTTGILTGSAAHLAAYADMASISAGGGTAILAGDGTTLAIRDLAANYLVEASGESAYGPSLSTWIQSGSYGTDGGYRAPGVDPDHPNSAAVDHKQDFAFYTGAPIPEPAFYQLSALLGMGALGSIRLLKKSRKS